MKFWKFLFLLLPFCAVFPAESSFLSEAQLQSCVSMMPEPPSFESAAFAYDKQQYEWGKSQRDTSRGKRASADAETALTYISHIFSNAIGQTISPELTPKTYAFLTELNETTKAMSVVSKRLYFRPRPYVYFNEPTSVPEKEAHLRHSSSYPSGHTTLGWSMALVLAELFPEKSTEIFKCGYEYGQSRVIAGYHYQTDVDAGRVISSTLVALAHSEPKFQRMISEAKAELKSISEKR